MVNQDKRDLLDKALLGIEKKHGKGSAMRMGDRPILDIQVIPTGSLALDVGLGIKGYPRGRIVEIYGPESAGKTTLTLHAIAEVQKGGGIAAFIDAEHALDPVYARKLGVNVEDLVLSQPDNGEQALEIAEDLVRSGAIDLLVVDSVAALVPKAEIEGEMGDSHMGLQARLMSQAMRKLSGIISKTNTTAIFINQIREKIGIVFGNPETTTGGRALKFYASIRLEIRKGEALKVGTDVIGYKGKVKVVKNKMAPPFKQVEFDVIFGEGISYTGEILDIGSQYDIVEKSGSWYSYNGERLAQGREKARELLKTRPELVKEIADKVYAKLNGVPDDFVPEKDEKDPLLED